MLDIIALAFAARVNIFQEFYCEYMHSFVARAVYSGCGEEKEREANGLKYMGEGETD